MVQVFWYVKLLNAERGILSTPQKWGVISPDYDSVPITSNQGTDK